MSAPDLHVFKPLLPNDYIDTLGMGVVFDKNETNIVWELGRSGPQSIYKLTQPIEQAEIPFARTARDKLMEKKETKNYYRDFVSKIIHELEEKGMVGTRKDPKNRRNPTIVELTLQGLLLYIRESTGKRRFIQAIENYPQHLPFSKNWEALNEKLGQEYVYDALEQATKNCVNLRKAAFSINPLCFKFEGILEDIFVSGEIIKVLKERNKKTKELLQTQQASVLRDSYIAYLAVHDLMRLRKQNRKIVEELIPTLNSERELAYFEGREAGTDSLFKGNHLREFFPKYAGVEYFLTGMFVENLLWQQKTFERTQEEYDYEVEFQHKDLAHIGIE